MTGYISGKGNSEVAAGVSVLGGIVGFAAGVSIFSTKENVKKATKVTIVTPTLSRSFQCKYSELHKLQPLLGVEH
jgi:hypothetical protein